MMVEAAWYDVRREGWVRDVLVLLHPPYSLWFLSYVVIGAALAPKMNWSTLLWTLLAFFLAMVIGAHCLDELNGRPLRTKLPGKLLWTLAIVSIAGAIAIGAALGVRETVWVIPCIIFGGFIVFAYNLEWPRDWARFRLFREFGLVGFFHRDLWFGVAWGAFPAVTAYIAQTYTVSWGIAGVAAACLLYSMAQRVLSFHGRFWRRKVMELRGKYYVEGEGSVVPETVGWNLGHDLTRQSIIEPAEVALRFMTWTIIAAAAGLILTHL